MTDLASLKAERAAIMQKLAEIEASRAKLSETDTEVTRCESSLQKFANDVSERVDAWTGGGCIGHRPEPAFDAHAKLEEKLHRALFARENAKTARDTLDLREETARKELAAVTWRLKDAAIRQIQFELAEQGEAILAFRAQLATLEASQLGAHAFVQALDDEIYERTKLRSPAFGFHRGGIQGLPGDEFSRAPADPSRVREWRDRFGCVGEGGLRWRKLQCITISRMDPRHTARSTSSKVLIGPRPRRGAPIPKITTAPAE